MQTVSRHRFGALVLAFPLLFIVLVLGLLMLLAAAASPVLIIPFGTAFAAGVVGLTTIPRHLGQHVPVARRNGRIDYRDVRQIELVRRRRSRNGDLVRITYRRSGRTKVRHIRPEQLAGTLYVG
jgi:hypothetical protein